MCLDFGCVETVEFAIEQRVERRFAFGATGHLLPSFPSRDRNSVASMTRARASLDITVPIGRSEEHQCELQSLMRKSYAAFCMQNKNVYTNNILQRTQ